MVDGSLPEMAEVTPLLRRFGPVVDRRDLTGGEFRDQVAAHGPNGMVTYVDAEMVDYANLATILSLPFHSPATAWALTDKAEQRRRLADAGLTVPTCRVVGPSATGRTLAELAGQSWPAILKPRSAQGSRYTYFARDAEDAIRYLKALGPDRLEMIVEDYLPDDPDRSSQPYADYVSVESIVSQGTISHLAVTGRFPLADNFRETGFFIPADLTPSEEAATLQLATSAIRALDVRTGCLHSEIKFTPDGLRVIEVNGRAGGGVPEMLDRASGLQLLELSLRVALGQQARVDGPVATERIGYRFFLQPPAVTATVASIEGIDTFTDRSGADTVSIHKGPGAGFDWRDGTRNHIVAVVGSVDDYEELLSVERLLHGEITVTYSDVRH